MKQLNKFVTPALVFLSLVGAVLRFYDIIFFVGKDGLYIEESAVSLALALLVIVTAALSLCFGFFILPKQELRISRKNNRSALLSSCFIIAGGLILLSSAVAFLGTDTLKLRDRPVLFAFAASFFGILSGSFFIYSGIQLRLFSRLPCEVYAPVFSVLWSLFRMISDFTSAPPLAPMSTRSYRTIVLASMCIFLFFFAKSLSGIDESEHPKPLCAFGVLFSTAAAVVLLPDLYFYISIKDITSVLAAVADISLAALALSYISYRRYCPPRPLLH